MNTFTSFYINFVCTKTKTFRSIIILISVIEGSLASFSFFVCSLTNRTELVLTAVIIRYSFSTLATYNDIENKLRPCNSVRA
jgi:hypothetical protein